MGSSTRERPRTIARWLQIAPVLLVSVHACSDTAHVVDAGRDAATFDLGLPGCSPSCAAGEVCDSGKCVTPGPSRSCGASPYAEGLPSTGVIYVDAAHAGASDGSKLNPFKTIAAAVAAATGLPAPGPDGGVRDGGATADLRASSAAPIIAVATGIYDEELLITASLELRCRCAEKVRITGPVTVKAETTDIAVAVDGCEIAPKGWANEPQDWGSCTVSSKKACKQPADCTAPELCDPLALECVHPREGKDRGLIALSGEQHGVRLAVRDTVLAGWCRGLYINTGAGSPSALCLTRSRLWGNRTGIEAQNAPPISASAASSECAGLEEAVAATRSRIDQNEHAGVFTRGLARGLGLRSNLIAASGYLQTASGLRQTTGVGGFGIYLGNTSTTHIESNVIRQSANVGLGMINSEVIADTAFAITGNLFEDNRGAGISLQQLQASKEVRIIGNRVTGARPAASTPGGDGIQVLVAHGTSYRVKVQANQVSASQRHGILLDGVSGTVDANLVAGSAGYGVFLQQAPQVAVGSNTLSGNAKGTVFQSASPVELCGALPLPLP